MSIKKNRPTQKLIDGVEITFRMLLKDGTILTASRVGRAAALRYCNYIIGKHGGNFVGGKLRVWYNREEDFWNGSDFSTKAEAKSILSVNDLLDPYLLKAFGPGVKGMVGQPAV